MLSLTGTALPSLRRWVNSRHSKDQLKFSWQRYLSRYQGKTRCCDRGRGDLVEQFQTLAPLVMVRVSSSVTGMIKRRAAPGARPELVIPSHLSHDDTLIPSSSPLNDVFFLLWSWWTALRFDFPSLPLFMQVNRQVSAAHLCVFSLKWLVISNGSLKRESSKNN